MTIFDHYILAHALIAISTIVIGLFVFLRGPDKPLNRIFLFYNSCMACAASASIGHGGGKSSLQF